MHRRIVWTLGLFLSMNAAQAEDLLNVYQRALSNDPQIREADANRRATRESKPQALAALLPQVSGTASYDKDETDGTSTSTFVLNGVLTPSDRSGDGDSTTSAGAWTCARACSRGTTGSR
jgi:outer membrane protein TolC